MLIHLSTTKNIKVLKPRIPETAVTSYENTTIARNCFSDSIDKCLSALQGDPGIYYVYIPLNKHIKYYKTKKKDVFDSFITSECWTFEPTKVICIGSIKNKGIIKSISYKINQKPYRISFKICDWEWIDKNEESINNVISISNNYNKNDFKYI